VVCAVLLEDAALGVKRPSDRPSASSGSYAAGFSQKSSMGPNIRALTVRSVSGAGD
jgi:hypothetical protein